MKNSWLTKLILVLFFLFPILTATVRDAGSIIYGTLILFSLFHFRKGTILLSQREKHFFWGLVVFFVFSCLSLFMTEDLPVGIPRFERYARLIFLIPVYCMLREKTVKTEIAFLSGSVVALFVMLGQTIYQIEILGLWFAHGAYHKIIMGDMAVFFTVLVFLSAVFYGRKKIHYIFFSLAVGAGVYAMMLTLARTAWLFVPIIIFSLVWLYKGKLSRRNLGTIAMGVATTRLVLLVLQPRGLVWNIKQGWSDLKTFSKDSNNTSFGTRLVLWRNSLLIFKENPIFGTGTGDFRHDSTVLLERGISYDNALAASQTNAHSIYFMLLAEGGLVGLSILVIVLFSLPFKFLYGLWKNTSDKSLHFSALLGLISIIAFAWFGVSESWINRNPMVNTYCMAILAFMSRAANRAKELKLELSKGRFL